VLPSALTARFDLVSFDPRGVARSHAVRCDSDLIQNSPSFIPTDTSSYQTIRAYSTALHASCLRDTGPLVDHVDEISVAKDIDALRVALGEDKLILYGISHGTLTGEMYAENFPTHVRALVLDSVKDDSLSTSAVPGRRELDRRGLAESVRRVVRPHH
jgi:pimeloyl-ACP methyl ester carboxylesterase